MEVEMRYDQKWKSIPAAPKEAKNLNGSFDCNICLDFANEPVVTLCGHLYCWPCIYKWFHVQSASLSSDEYPQCPVCKAEISHTTVVPLYGRGQSLSNPELEAKACSRDMGIPPRPPACGTRALLNAAEHPNHQLLPYRNPYQRPYATGYLGSEEPISSPSSLSQRNDRIANVFQPAVDGVLQPLERPPQCDPLTLVIKGEPWWSGTWPEEDSTTRSSIIDIEPIHATTRGPSANLITTQTIAGD
uniref:E3 ubiquitin-protein ligase RMA n=1 Tax=Chenopodium quinoa TaxID=63459 RepID=A0A803LPY1_CHEQI